MTSILRSFPLVAVAACISVSGCAMEGAETDGADDDESVQEATQAMGGGATVFEHASFGGFAQPLLLGNQIPLLGGVSSLAAPPGIGVTLCGPASPFDCQWFSGSVPYVGNSMNDYATVATVAQTVVVYEHANFQGRWQTIQANTGGVSANTGTLTVPNDSISSIEIPPLMRAFLCKNESDPEFQCLQLFTSMSYIGNAFNDSVSKVYVRF